MLSCWPASGCLRRLLAKVAQRCGSAGRGFVDGEDWRDVIARINENAGAVQSFPCDTLRFPEADAPPADDGGWFVGQTPPGTFKLRRGASSGSSGVGGRTGASRRQPRRY